MAHVGDGHPQQPALALALHLHGIVKVAGVRAVNGHQWQMAQILTPGHIRLAGSRG